MFAAEFTALTQRPLPAYSRLLMQAVMTFVIWDLRRRTRADLRRLTPHMLTDIGLDTNRAQSEADKPFWRA